MIIRGITIIVITIIIIIIIIIPVVQSYRPAERGSRVGRPGDELLAPVHAHVVVHVPRGHHLPLGGVPAGVVRLPALELRVGVGFGAGVRGVPHQRGLRPVRQAGERVVLVAVEAEVAGELAAHDELLQKGGAAAAHSAGPRAPGDLLHL